MNNMLSLKNLPVRVSSVLCGWIFSICAIGITEPAEASVQRTALVPRALQDTSYSKVDVMPSPKDGMKAFYQFIGQNYKYPKAAIDAKIEGRLLIQFVVEKDGSLTDIKVLRDLGHGTGDEAVRMLKSAPKWIPGIQNGKPVRVQFTLPLQLNQPKLQQEKETSEQS